MTERPILIDQNDGPCDICETWSKNKLSPPDSSGKSHRKCDECAKIIPIMDGMWGNGIQSTMPHHFHLKAVNGWAPGREGIFQELCLECYIAHRQKYWPPTQKDKHGNNHPDAETMLRKFHGEKIDERRTVIS